MFTIFALDPSILHLGWSCMYKHEGNTGILCSGTIKATKNKDDSPEKRILYMLRETQTVYDNCFLDYHTLLVVKSGRVFAVTRFDQIVIECPEPWGAYKSLASSRSGSLDLLMLLTGGLVGWANSRNVPPVLVKVSTWKGQLPKHMTKKRMERKYQTSFETSDEADATGLGDWFLTNRVENDSLCDTIPSA